MNYINELKREGFEPWLDKFNLHAGEKWKIKIREAIIKSRIVLACVSKNTNRDGYYCKEFRQALTIAEEKDPNTIYIIPCFIDDVEMPVFEVDTTSLNEFHEARIYTDEGKKRLIDDLHNQIKVTI